MSAQGLLFQVILRSPLGCWLDIRHGVPFLFKLSVGQLICISIHLLTCPLSKPSLTPVTHSLPPSVPRPDLALIWPPCAEGLSEERDRCGCAGVAGVVHHEDRKIRWKSQRLKKAERWAGWRGDQEVLIRCTACRAQEDRNTAGGVQGLCIPGCKLRQETGLRPVLNLHTVSLMAGVPVHLAASPLFLP